MAPGGKPHYKSNKGRRYCDIMETARGMLAHPQSIRCLEAVMLAIHLTNQQDYYAVDRVPVGFKSSNTITGHEYRCALIQIRRMGGCEILGGQT